MSNNVEDQIVSMQFDNKQFESGVATSMASIDKLKGTLAFPDAGKGLADVNTAVSRFNMNPMASAIQGVSKMWLGLTTVAVTAISNITNKVVDAGLSMGKSLLIDPITQGFSEYEKNLNSIQTIMANTGKGVDVVNKYLGQLNHYSDQTIYNFGTMADAIGKFTAAGVKVDDATSAIKGMANSAALGGSDVNQLNTAMYQVSQALATGTIKLMDWNSISTAGLGGQNMQDTFKATAMTIKGTGEEMQAAVAKAGNFRDSLQAGWFSSDVFNKAMKVMAGRTNAAGKTVAYTAEQLQKMGYSEEAAKKLTKLSQAAIDSATKVKTFSQLIDVVKESIGSGWSQVFQNLFGNFTEASKLWTGVSQSITGGVSRVFNAVNGVLTAWRGKDGQGFKDLWAGIGNIFKVLGNLFAPFANIFKAFLPTSKAAGGTLQKLTAGFADFTGWLVKITDPLNKIKPDLSFVGKAFGIVAKMVSAFVVALKPLVPILKDVGAQIGSLFDQGVAIAQNLIAGWTAGLDPKELQNAAVDLANSWIQWIKDALGIHSPAQTMIPIGENIVQGIVQGLINAGQWLVKAGQQLFLGLGKAFKWAVENISYDDVLNTINSGLFLGIVLLFKKFIGQFGELTDSFSAVMGKAGGVLDQYKDNLKSMQTEVRAKAIMEIAAAVGILAVSAVLLSSVPIEKLKAALAAIGGLMISLVAAMKILTGGSKKKTPDAKTIAKQSGQILAIGAALIEFSTAILILAGAVAIMGQLDPKTMQQGLEGIAAIVAGVVAATAILSKTGGGATILATATALIILSVGLTAFVGVMKLYSKLDWGLIKEGGGKAALVILAVGLAMRSFSKGSLSGAAGMVLAAVALRIMAKALVELDKIDGGKLIVIALALDILMVSMGGIAEVANPASAGSLIGMAVAILILAKAIEVIGKLGIGKTLLGIGAIVLAIVLLAGTAAALSELSPLVLALGIALGSLGAAIFLAGAGVFLFASAMGILAVVGPAAFQAMADGIDQMLELLPKIGEGVGIFLVSILTGIAEAAGPLTKALGKLLNILIDELQKLLPKVGQLIEQLVRIILHIIVSNQLAAARAMIRFVVGMLNALNDGVPRMIRAGTRLIISIIEGLSANAVRIANATGRAILQFLNGIDAAIVTYAPQIRTAGLHIARDLIDGLTGGLLTEGVTMVENAVRELASHIPGPIKKFLGINSPSKVFHEIGLNTTQGLVNGMNKGSSDVEKSAVDMATGAVDALSYAFRNSKKGLAGLEDLSPKITPVLDLTQFAKDASEITSHMGHPVLTADVSRRRARDISANEHRRTQHGDVAVGDTYNFEQNNYSPKPINHKAAYRGQKSQIALFREVTGK